MNDVVNAIVKQGKTSKAFSTKVQSSIAFIDRDCEVFESFGFKKKKVKKLV
jgi:hypothetical protein